MGAGHLLLAALTPTGFCTWLDGHDTEVWRKGSSGLELLAVGGEAGRSLRVVLNLSRMEARDSQHQLTVLDLSQARGL